MTVPTIRLAYSDLMLDAAKLEGKFVDAQHYDRVVYKAATILKPDGRLLLTYAPDALPKPLCAEVFEALKPLRPATASRGIAAGGSRKDVPSEVLGFLDRDPRIPWCRMTTFTREHYEAYEATLPLLVAVNDAYRDLVPERWEAQRRFATHVSPDFIIPGTVFSSITFNRNFRTAAHADRGNHRPGLEAIVVLGEISAGEIIFPRFRTAVAVCNGGLLLADMHELHGNAPLLGRGPRLSLVCYARAGMGECGSAAQEWGRAAAYRAR